MSVTEVSDIAGSVGEIVAKARAAQATFAASSQDEVDLAVRAVAWSLYEEGRATELAELAVADTGLGNVADKIVKNQRKTFGDATRPLASHLGRCHQR